MRDFEYGDLIETTLGMGNFVDYSNGGQSYKIAFVDGDFAGSELSVSERAIKTLGRKNNKTKIHNEVKSKYAPYIGNEEIFDAPVDLNKNPELLSEFMKQASTWRLLISSSPDAVEEAEKELLQLGIENPTDYIRISGPNTHGVKYDLFVLDPNISDIDVKLGLYFNPIRLNSTGCYQIGRKEFALHVVQQVVLLEVGEPLPKIA